MTENDKLQIFEDHTIRTAWNETQEEWYFSVVDVVAVLTEQKDNRRAAKYWSVLKTRLKNEGSELTTNCSQLKMKAADGKRRLTDVANTEQLLRIIQSIPSKKAEPFKAWLAKGCEVFVLPNLYGDRTAKLEKALDICCNTEKKLVVTTDKDGATSEEFTTYLLDTLKAL